MVEMVVEGKGHTVLGRSRQPSPAATWLGWGLSAVFKGRVVLLVLWMVVGLTRLDILHSCTEGV